MTIGNLRQIYLLTLTTMLSESQLLNHIEELSSAIEHQQDLLRNLERNRSNARRALNAICSPIIARLPIEILSVIFEFCPERVQDEYVLTNILSAPLLLLRVCRLWRDIVLSSPCFWNTVAFNSRSWDGHYLDASFIAKWLGRARALPLHLRLSSSIVDDVNAQDVIKHHAAQVQTLSLNGSLAVGSLSHQLTLFSSSLRTLDISGLHGVSIFDCLESIRSAPLLSELCIGYLERSSYGSQPTMVILGSLKKLRFEHKELLPLSTQILRFLTLPALENLHLSYGLKHIQVHDTSEADLCNFFFLSPPSLLSLDINGLRDWENELAYLRFIPSLTDLSVECDNHSAASSVLAKMVAGTYVLPNLQRFTMRNSMLDGCLPGGYDDLRGFLVHCRRSRPVLSLLRLTFPLIEEDVPLLHCLSNLPRYTEGRALHVHIGPDMYTTRFKCLCFNCCRVR
ncbi:hypothetical protein R3P38DRAFT_2872024 [Favolaschia claudopus]|uniref:F-box domain-containing protein n=1 Tax=Favolaschia claudopus TaxID=2862362 RepID=A0AAW0DCJ7_9AGAR